jgi:hypothetical protein
MNREDVIGVLKAVDSIVNMSNVITDLREREVDYQGWNDLKMIINYLENQK